MVPRRDAPTPTVLLVTACPWTARAVDAALGASGLTVMRAVDLDAAIALGAANWLDAAVIDERVAPDASGRGEAACRRLATLSDIPGLPTMMLVRDPVDSRGAEALFAAGAWGIAHYPLGGASWVHQLSGWIRATRGARRRLDDGLLLDPATGLYNARGIEQRALEIDATARRTGGALACAVFAPATPRAWTPGGWHGSEAMNDDASAVRRVADACRRVGRASDVFGRLGPTEFAVIAPGADVEGARMLVARIGDALDETEPSHDGFRVGICAVPETRTAALSVADMLAHAASRA